MRARTAGTRKGRKGAAMPTVQICRGVVHIFVPETKGGRRGKRDAH